MPPELASAWAGLPPTLPVNLCTLFSAALMFGGFVLLLFVGSIVVPGKVELGAPLAGGERRSYKLNGLSLFMLLVGLMAFGTATGLFSPAVIHAHFWSLLIVANVFAFGLTALLYVKGRAALEARGESVAPGWLNVVKDAFYGLELNPSYLGVDLKMFSYRPSLMGLGLLNVSFAFVQFQLHGEVSTRMWLFQIFYFAYLVNYFQFEHGMLYTWDIIAEKFGWMLVWGDYALVPFFYSMAGWYLVGRVDPMPGWEVVLVIGLYLFGFWLFRGANDQKHRYKIASEAAKALALAAQNGDDPVPLAVRPEETVALIWGKPAEVLGGRLLVSGFWGIGRKLNYSGELCMYLAWTLPAGFISPVPWLLPFWLLCLFTHRAWRDEQRCSEKYGPLWTEYCQRATFRMFPGVY